MVLVPEVATAEALSAAQDLEAALVAMAAPEAVVLQILEQLQEPIRVEWVAVTEMISEVADTVVVSEVAATEAV